MELYGRSVVKTSCEDFNSKNIVQEVNKAIDSYRVVKNEIQYLWDYYRGKQPILKRVKEIRPEINNKIVENRANEIVNFKVGYLFGEPVQYISRGGNEKTSNDIAKLNAMMFSENKASLDKEIGEWMMICGTAYRLVLPDEGKIDEAPFELITLSPLSSFVVYSMGVKCTPLLGIIFWKDDNDTQFKEVYSKDRYWLIKEDKIIEEKPHILGCVPIFEYPANTARLGAFETVLSLLDAINEVESDRKNAIEQTVQAFLKFINCDVDADQLLQLRELGAIKVKSLEGQKAEVDVVKTELDQNQVQTTVEHYYQSILTICGMPNRNGGSSTSDTGSAVILRDGWELAESRAKASEMMFKRSEQEMLKLVLKICSIKGAVDLKISDIDMQFTRRNYEAIVSKSQVLTSMLNQPKIHPSLAFIHSGMFTDPEKAYALSDEYYQQTLKEAREPLQDKTVREN